MRIIGNCLVKNEERYLWYAVKSVIDYLDEMLIWDTGSTDNTKKIIELLADEYPKKIRTKFLGSLTPEQLTQTRQQMLEESRGDWVILIDGDEVWWRDSISSLRELVEEKKTEMEAVVTPFINCLGDIYHYQDNKWGRYQIDNHKGFITLRAFSRNIPGLHYAKNYPLEGLFDDKENFIQNRNSSGRIYLDKPYLHFSHLIRSSSLQNSRSATKRQLKYKYELGNNFPLDYYYPEVFFENRPKIISSPWVPRDIYFMINSYIEVLPRTIKRLFFK